MNRRNLGTAAALVLAGALGTGCVDSAADETAGRPQPLPPQESGAQAPRQEPAPAVRDEPHGSRPIDDGAIRALAEEVARLRAELARMRAEDVAAAEAPREEKAAPVAAPEPARAPAPGQAPAPAPAPAVAAAPEPQTAPPAPERVVELERVVEREVPVFVDREVVVEREVPVYVQPSPTVVYEQVVYEQVVYRDVHCHQYVPTGHVHHVGCGHHYYGCACHPWYYDLDGGIDITFVWFDVDDHRRPCPTPRGRYRAGYRDGYRDGFRDGDFHHAAAPARPIRERAPAAPARHAPVAISDRPAAVRPPSRTLEDRTPAAAEAPPAGSVDADSRTPFDAPARRSEEPQRRAPQRPRTVADAGPDVAPRPDAARPDPVRPAAERRPTLEARRDPPAPARRIEVPVPRAPLPDRGQEFGAERGPGVQFAPPAPEVVSERPRERQPARDLTPRRDDPPGRRAAPERRPEPRPERHPDPVVRRPAQDPPGARALPPVVRPADPPRTPRRPDAPDRRRRREFGEAD